MVSDVDFVKAGVEAGNPPPVPPTPLSAHSFEDMPADEFVRREQAAREQGQTLMVNDDGTPFNSREPVKSTSLFRPEVRHALFGPDPDQAPTTIDRSVASDQAYSTSLINGDMGGYAARRDANLEAGRTVQDEVLTLTKQMINEQGLFDSEILAPETYDAMSPVERIQALQREVDRLDLREVTPLNIALIEAFYAGAGEVRLPEFQKWARTVPITDLRTSMENRMKSQRRKALMEVDSVVAAQGWDSWMDAVVEIGYQDLTPVFPLFSRLGILKGIEEAAGIESKGGWLLGERRQNIRENLYAMNSEEFLTAAKQIRAQIEEWRKDPIKSKLVTRYALLEQFEAIFTDDVNDGKSAKNTGDRWLGNVETFLEAFFSVVVVAKAGKGIVRAFSATDVVTAKQLATASGKAKVAASIDEQLQVDRLALDVGLEADEAVPALLPRPVRFVDNVEDLPDGTKNVVVRNERVREELLDSSDSLTGQVLTKADKTNVVNASIKALDLADGAHVQGRMSVLQMKANGTGFDLRVVVGESAEGGYKNIQDAIDEALVIDPNLEKMRIMRVNREGVLEPVFMDADEFARAAAKGEVDPTTAGRIVGGDTADETFYLTYDTERYWHSIDKEAFGGETFLNAGMVPRAILSPNAKFGDEIYGKFLRAHMGEQTIHKNFEILFTPYYKLSKDDKKFAASVFEWMEDFGKNHGRAPTSSEVMAKYDGITEKQLSGITSLRDGMDTMHELFNRRLYRDWQSQGFKTARPANTQLPTFHGKALDRVEAGRGGGMLDPETGKIIKPTAKELDDTYNAGGRVMELDMAVDAANEARSTATRILIREGTYEVGELSTKPLKYHPGYSIRFYDDPYYVVKETTGVSLNGAVRAQSASSVASEALRTAGTLDEAERFAAKLARSDAEKGIPGVTYKAVRANNITQTESSLFQKQSIHREGRLFWDQRNFDRLPDVNGNRAVLEDPVKALERGIGIAARQLTHEDMLKGVKNAWKNDYGKLIDDNDVLTRFDLKEISQRLRDKGRNTAGKAEAERIKQARELIDYMRLIEGTEQQIVPWMREHSLSIATTVNRMTGANSKGIEKFAMTVDPFRTMRSVAFNLFMVARPVRQALLQSSQIGYLAALSPKYVASPQFFKDALALRRGLTKLRKSGYDDGFGEKYFAKMMGITQKEYKVLLREFDRSGIADLVDVHSFAGGTRGFNKTTLPKSESIAGTIGYRARYGTNAAKSFMKEIGFNLGEGNNLVFTYNLARKRLMDKKGYKSVLDLTRKDWDDLRVDASNLALGMVKPNSFGYQTGAVGVATQFFSFGHKAALGLIGANPAIKGKDAVKVIMGTYLLYGSNMFGARDFVHEQLVKIGVPDQTVPGTNISLVDYLSGGMIDSTFNMIGDLTVKDWKDVDLGFVAPGLDFNRVWEQTLENVLHQPAKAAMGPFGNIASKFLTSLEFSSRVLTGQPDLPAGDKFTVVGNSMLSGTFPIYNDAMQSYIGYQMNQWYSTAGEPLPLQPTMNGMIARGLFGARTREELSWYRLQNKVWEDTQTYNNIRDTNREYLRKLATALGEGTMTEAEVHRNTDALVSVYEEWPEAVRVQLFADSMGELVRNDQVIPSVYKTLIDVLGNDRLSPELINEVIDRFVDIPVEKREQLRDLAQSAYESRVYVDAAALDEIKEQEKGQ